MEVEGKIIQCLERSQGVSKAGNAWKKDEYVLETLGTYPRKVKFTIFGDKCDQMRCELGKTYAISFDIDSREFNGRWYTDINAYAVREIGQEMGNGGATAPQQSTFEAPAAAAPGADPFAAPSDEADDLPF